MIMLINGAGTIEKRGKDSYRIRFNLGRDPITGKYKHTPWRVVHGNKGIARRALEEYRREIEGGLRIDMQGTTFGQFAESFMEEREALGVLAVATLEGDRYVYKKHLEPYLGEVLLTDITTQLLKDVFIDLVQNKGVTQNRMHDIVMKVKQILREAAMADIIIRNPADKIKTPARPKPCRNSLKTPQVTKLLSALERIPLDRNTMAVYLGVATGMRRGEVLALQWNNIDLDDMSLRVTHALDPYKQRKEPKTRAGIRKISLDELTIEKLKQWENIQKSLLKVHNATRTEDTFVCSTRTGTVCEPSRFYQWFKDFCVQNDFGIYLDEDGKELPKKRFNKNGHPIDKDGKPYTRMNKKPVGSKYYRGLRFHELRHTHATLLIANGVDIKTVQNRLGHSKAAMTLDFYAHAQEEQDRKAVDLFSNLVNS